MVKVAQIVGIASGTAVGLYLAWLFRGEFLLFFLSIVTAAVLSPFCEAIQRRGHSYMFSVLCVYAIVIGGTIALAAALAGPLARDFAALMTDCGHVYRYAIERWPEGNRFERFLVEFLPSSDKMPENLADAVNLPLAMRFLGVGGGILDLLLKAVLIVVISIYWKLDNERLERLFLSCFSLPRRKLVRGVVQDVQVACGDYLRCKTIESLAAGTILGIALYASGFPYPAAVALVFAALLLIPWLGLPLGVAVLWGASYANFLDVTPTAALLRGVFASGFALLLLAVLKTFVEPRLLDKKRFNSLLVFAITISMIYTLGGIAIILGPPVAVALEILCGHFLNRSEIFGDSEKSLASALRNSRERAIAWRQHDGATPIFLDIAGRWSDLATEAENAIREEGDFEV